MSDISEDEAFARLVMALKPQISKVVFIGGWAHRLYPYLEGVERPNFQPLMTYDADIATSAKLLGTQVRLDELLTKAGFTENLMSDHRPPVARYSLGNSENGFYAEFLTPLHGSGVKKDGEPDATEHVGGVLAQKLRYIDVLLINPWKVNMAPEKGFKVPEAIEINVANPVAYLAQKLLVLDKRSIDKRAKDILYIHDTLQIVSSQFETLAQAWSAIKKEMPPKWVADVQKAVIAPHYTGANRLLLMAAQIAERSGRANPPSAERIGEICRVGLAKVFN